MRELNGNMNTVPHSSSVTVYQRELQHLESRQTKTHFMTSSIELIPMDLVPFLRMKYKVGHAHKPGMMSGVNLAGMTKNIWESIVIGQMMNPLVQEMSLETRLEMRLETILEMKMEMKMETMMMRMEMMVKRLVMKEKKEMMVPP